jgi:Protein of unknown function (DUF2842)
MRMRTRKLIGTVALLALVTGWALLAMVVAQIALPSAGGLLSGIYYVVAGLGWVLPAMPLVAWMVKPDDAGPKTKRGPASRSGLPT